MRENATTSLPADDPKQVSALVRGLAILKCFSPQERLLTNADLSLRTNLPKATVSRLAYTLCKQGYLRQVKPDGAYQLSVEGLSLGLSVIAATGLKDRAADELEYLARDDDPNIAAALGEMHRDSVVYLATHGSSEGMAMTFHLGAKVPLLTSAIGRAVIVALPEDQQEQILARLCEKASDDLKARLRMGLDKARQDYAQYGFCTSFGDWNPRINAIAAPFLSADKKRVFAVNVGGFSFFTREDNLINHYGPRLLQAVENLAIASI